MKTNPSTRPRLHTDMTRAEMESLKIPPLKQFVRAPLSTSAYVSALGAIKLGKAINDTVGISRLAQTKSERQFQDQLQLQHKEVDDALKEDQKKLKESLRDTHSVGKSLSRYINYKRTLSNSKPSSDDMNKWKNAQEDAARLAIGEYKSNNPNASEIKLGRKAEEARSKIATQQKAQYRKELFKQANEHYYHRGNYLKKKQDLVDAARKEKKQIEDSAREEKNKALVREIVDTVIKRSQKIIGQADGLCNKFENTDRLPLCLALLQYINKPALAPAQLAAPASDLMWSYRAIRDLLPFDTFKPPPSSDSQTKEGQYYAKSITDAKNHARTVLAEKSELLSNAQREALEAIINAETYTALRKVVRNKEPT